MEMCPYCGDEVAEDAKKCEKCGAVLIDGEEAEELYDEEIATGPTLVPCPNCNAPQPPKAHRCKECGRVINELEGGEDHTAFKLGAWAAFAGVGLLIVVILAIVIATHKQELPRKYVPMGYGVLAKRYDKRILNAKSQEKWEKELKNRFVKWSGEIVSIDGEVVEVAMSKTSKKKNKADIRVTFQGSEDLSKLAKGGVVSYDARLVSHNEEEFRFVLDEAKLVLPESDE